MEINSYNPQCQSCIFRFRYVCFNLYILLKMSAKKWTIIVLVKRVSKRKFKKRMQYTIHRNVLKIYDKQKGP